MKKQHNRRSFMKLAAAAAAVSITKTSNTLSQETLPLQPESNQPKFNLGLASYTLKEFKLDKVLEISKKLNLKYLCFKDFHLALNSTPEQISEAVKKVNDSGCTLYAGGVIYMTNENQVNQAFDYAKAAGMKIIVGSPNHNLLPLIDKKVQQYDIKVAIHNHGPGDRNYPTAQSVYELIQDLDNRIGLCLDIGHTQRLGLDPSEAVEKYNNRLLDVHIKDVTSATARGSAIEIGRGVIDIPKFLRTLSKTNYSGKVSFEYEKDPNDPVAGLAESIGYVRGVLDSI
ncbi:MAG: sugar phosphate isomerase/epimerase [Sedimentisphaerales bacterium]|nr:sugar phosphate isomerase/epimerase [Sedimentisphaerales bacterium]